MNVTVSIILQLLILTYKHRMMDETSEAEYERFLELTRNIQEAEVVNLSADADAEADESVLDDSEDNIVMLEEPPPAAPSAAPSTTAGPDPPDVHTDSAAANKDKVNDLVVNMSPARKSVDNSNRESDSGSGYQESESENLRNSLFNYSKYGTRSKVGEGETLIESEKPVMPSTYYQCKSARHASRNYPTVDVSIGPSAGVSENVKHRSVGSFECHGDTEIPNAPLRNYKFKTNSSHTTTIGFDSLAFKELLASLINKLQCTFATAAHSEDILLEAPAELESKLEKKRFTFMAVATCAALFPNSKKMFFM